MKKAMLPAIFLIKMKVIKENKNLIFNLHITGKIFNQLIAFIQVHNSYLEITL
jgi:hypothetical protein